MLVSLLLILISEMSNHSYITSHLELIKHNGGGGGAPMFPSRTRSHTVNLISTTLGGIVPIRNAFNGVAQCAHAGLL